MCIGKEIEVLLNHRFSRRPSPKISQARDIFSKGILGKVGSFLSEAHPSFRQSCSPDFLPRFLSARLLYRDLEATTRIAVPLAREKVLMLLVTASRDKSNRRDGKLDETQFPSARSVAGNATPRSFDASADFSRRWQERERIPFDCRGLN